MPFGDIYRSKRVFITGHTGFKGSWLTQWLLELGAHVTGYSLPPPTSPSMFEQLGLESKIEHIQGDIRDLAKLRAAIAKSRPDFIFHLAAQPLVRLSYDQPVDTYSTNIMGTVNLLEAVRLESKSCVVIIVTTDKCYENKEWLHGYREDDPMGGYDPYSSSKGAAELVVSAYRRSYFFDSKLGIYLASARAGNVIGGGDWALDRIVPDCIKSLQRNEAILIRNKVATRPWQHVLEPLSGYLWLGACLANTNFSGCGDYLTSAFNFGPDLTSNKTVSQLVDEILKYWPGKWIDQSDPLAVHEAKLLNLATDKAYHLLAWKPTWNFEQSIKHTVMWYKYFNVKPIEFTTEQLNIYCDSARSVGLLWAN
jgi:CDP-glucose 4,6-dehydratase